MSIMLPGTGDPASTIAILRALADDLERLAMFQPRAELDGVPTLHNWSPTHRHVNALNGFVEGHPILGHRFATTSEIYAIDLERRWVRTLSRFYRLGDALAPNKDFNS